MDFPTASFGGGSGEEQDSHKSDKDERSFHRHAAHQISKLEEMFKEYSHPDESRRRQLGEELGLEPRQVKFWFQNRRTKGKNISDRLDNNALRLQNEKFRSENFVLRETLKNVLCLSCRRPTLREEDHEHCIDKIKLENALLRQERERLSELLPINKILNPMLSQTQPSSSDAWRSLLNQNVEIPAPDNDQRIPILDQQIPAADPDIPAFGHDIPTPVLDQDISTITSATNQNIPALDLDIPIPALDLGFDSVHGNSNDHLLPLPLSPVIINTDSESDKALMIEIGNTAMEELKRLLNINEPFWFRSIVDGKFILQHATYEKIFHTGNHLKGPHARIESSKDSQIVNIGATQLVDMLLNSDKWVDFFPTIVTKAHIMEVFESGLSGNQNGALQLMNANLHILSPLVPTREFVFLRYCKQVEEGVWVIADVSFDSSPYEATLSHTWRFPSGCMIQKITDGSSRVSWLEHVEVNDEIQPDHLFREVICSNNAYGAEKWLLTLERMCERFSCSTLQNINGYDIQGMIRLPQGRRSVMQLAHRMFKNFCGALDMSSNVDVPTNLTRLSNGRFRVSFRHSTEPGVAKGMIVSAAMSFWLPLSPQNVFDFLKDTSRRSEWDVLCYGSQMHEIQRISNRTHPGNCTSIFQPLIPKEKNMLILQESYIDPLGSLVVFAPLDVSTLNFAMRGEDSSLLPLLPSGFTISGDGRSNVVRIGNSGGSLVTIGYQILACNPSVTGQPDMESIDAVTTLVTSTVDKLKIALHCSNLD